MYDWMTPLSQVVGLLVALIALARWVWLRRIRPFIVEQLSELQGNGGKSAVDRIIKIEEKVDQFTKLQASNHRINQKEISEIKRQQAHGGVVLGLALEAFPPDIQATLKRIIAENPLGDPQ